MHYRFLPRMAIVAIASAVVAACVPPPAITPTPTPAPAPAPAPRPVVPAPSPVPTFSSWMDAPLTPGYRTYAIGLARYS